ncbi:MAG: hypothetical protein RLY20_3452 [Verrucomicrobiota bacterium]|jgi:hypothetical protein
MRSGNLPQMKLDDTQKQKVAQWIQEGAKLSDIQSRIRAEFKTSLTYMEVRFLVDDLKLVPKDTLVTASPITTDLRNAPPDATKAKPIDSPLRTEGVSIQVDQIARPGTIVSGQVTFTDGQIANWSLDQMGRLGLAPQQRGYKPSQSDIQEFQTALQSELTRLGF